MLGPKSTLQAVAMFLPMYKLILMFCRPIHQIAGTIPFQASGQYGGGISGLFSIIGGFFARQGGFF
jgi:hypothetical protein